MTVSFALGSRKIARFAFVLFSFVLFCLVKYLSEVTRYLPIAVEVGGTIEQPPFRDRSEGDNIQPPLR